jgi:hypothetical protein
MPYNMPLGYAPLDPMDHYMDAEWNMVDPWDPLLIVEPFDGKSMPAHGMGKSASESHKKEAPHRDSGERRAPLGRDGHERGMFQRFPAHRYYPWNSEYPVIVENEPEYIPVPVGNGSQQQPQQPTDYRPIASILGLVACSILAMSIARTSAT